MSGTSGGIRYKFDGVVSTDKTVFQNMKDLCRAAGSWLTYDVNQGKWAVIINRAGNSIKSYNDSNIIGAISVTGTGIRELYNSVQVEFPHQDLRDQHDFVVDRLPIQDRFAFEPDNPLNIQFDIVSDPVQAEILGLQELKQSRADKIIKFRTDFTSMGIKAGDIIDVTSSMYGFNQKKFRVITATEADGESGTIDISITALEYVASVYENDLYRYERSNQNGLVTLGYIGKCDVPVCDKYEIDARPRVIVKTTVPAGVVEFIEFYYTLDVPPGVTVDANRTYNLINRAYPKPGSVFTYGEEVSVELVGEISQFLVKCRAGNSQTAGEFSDPSGFVEQYDPVQSTENISQSTMTTDTAGEAWTALPLSNIIQKNDVYFGGNTTITFAEQNFKTITSDENTYPAAYSTSYGWTGTGKEFNIFEQAGNGWLNVSWAAQESNDFIIFAPYAQPVITPKTGPAFMNYDITLSGNISGSGSDLMLVQTKLTKNGVYTGSFDTSSLVTKDQLIVGLSYIRSITANAGDSLQIYVRVTSAVATTAGLNVVAVATVGTNFY